MVTLTFGDRFGFHTETWQQSRDFLAEERSGFSQSDCERSCVVEYIVQRWQRFQKACHERQWSLGIIRTSTEGRIVR